MTDPHTSNDLTTWLGRLPESWNLIPFRRLFKESSEVNGKSPVGPMLSVSGYRGVEIKEYETEDLRRGDDEVADYRVVRPGQLVMNTMWLNHAGLGVSAHEGHMSPAYRAYWIGERIDAGYAHHLLRSDVYVSAYTSRLKGIRPNSLQLGREDLMSLPVIVPPRADQRAIADFLDRETARIDAMVDAQERLVALLEERRRAAITQAVTAGISSGLELRDPGVPWSSGVPAHWAVVPLKHEISFLTSGSRGWAEYYSDEGEVFLRIGNLPRGALALKLDDLQHVDIQPGAEGSRARVRAGDLLFSITAYIGSVAVAEAAAEGAYVSQHVALARLTGRRLLPKFAGYFTLSDPGQRQLKEQAYGGTKVQLSLGDIRELRLTVPSIAEQAQIIDHLDRVTTRTDELIVRVRKSIALMKERRAAVISAAVTGRIDVRTGTEQVERDLEEARV